MTDRFLILSTTDPTTGYRLEHRKSVLPKGDDYWRVENPEIGYGIGATREEAIRDFHIHWGWKLPRVGG